MTADVVKKSRLFSGLSDVLRHRSMRPVVRVFTALHVDLYRLTGGKAQMAKYPTMLLTTKGRKTGKLRTIPLIYIQDGDCYVIAAAYAGSDQNPTWWLNLREAKEAEIQVMRTKVRVRAEAATAQAAGRALAAACRHVPLFCGLPGAHTARDPGGYAEPSGKRTA